MARIITVTPNPLLDFVADHPLVPRRVNRCTGFDPLPCGKGVNVAKVLARHGHAVEIRGFAGGPTGEWFAELLARRGLTPQLTTTAARLRCGFLAASTAGPPTSLMEDGFAIAPAEREALVADLATALPGADLVICSGSVPDRSCDDLLREIAERCAAAGIDCWIDAYGEAMDRAMAGTAPVALIKPNREEYAGLAGSAAAREIHLTDGPRPVRVRFPDGELLEAEPPPVTPVNPVGSGDCYLAGLAHARLTGRGREAQLAYALAAGAANAEMVTVAEIDPGRIDSLASTARFRKVEGHEL